MGGLTTPKVGYERRAVVRHLPAHCAGGGEKGRGEPDVAARARGKERRSGQGTSPAAIRARGEAPVGANGYRLLVRERRDHAGEYRAGKRGGARG